ncbi:transforming growth factor-beta-induced protein ig-h3-like [Penaeus monodon]|uniref:transforming growth factor-beta-induced protein ig-h3-like n=1 Tax=Penaeus monodon TaxID=6687 RepID=UPI0018A72AC2|nr:transforming growth factor-beta-induced protein ig-h3-like [Penaeus monodon]
MLKFVVALMLTTIFLSVDAGHYGMGRTNQKPRTRQGNLAEELTRRGFTTLVDLVTRAGLADTLSNQGPFTVFAPTNEAFKALDQNLVSYLLDNPEELKNVLLYHVVSGSVPSRSLSNDLVADSVQGSPLRINLRSRPSGVTVNGVDVIEADIKASNGIIHAVDQVLLAPQADIVGTLVGDDRFSTLVAAVTAAGLVDTLRGGPFTVFAPTNDAFAKLPPGTVDSLLGDIPALTEVLLRHVVPSTLYSRALLGNTYNTAGGDRLSVSQAGGRVNVMTQQNRASVIEADKTVTNGWLLGLFSYPNPLPATARFEMRRSILFFFVFGVTASSRAENYGLDRRQGNIAEVLTKGGFSTLLQLVARAGLAESAAEGGPFTIFAPTDEAFAALDPTVRNFLLSDAEALTTALLYHVVPGSVVGSALEDDLELGSAAGSVLKVNVVGSNPREVTVNGVKVQKADLTASNGVVHVIEKVLLPPKLTIVEALAGDGRFSTLVTAISLADLFETLDSDGPFTVFAPTDDALASLPQGTVDSFLQDIPAIRKGLLRLVLPSRLYSRALLGKTFRSVQWRRGESCVECQSWSYDLSVFQDNYGRLRVRTSVNTATIIYTDATLFNGVSGRGYGRVYKAGGIPRPLTFSLETFPYNSPQRSRNFFKMFRGLGTLLLLAGLVLAVHGRHPKQVRQVGSEGNLAEVLSGRGFRTLVDLVVKAGLADTVSNSGPFTVFAPTDEAFAALEPQLVNYLLENPEVLKNVLLYHVLPGQVFSSSLENDLVASSAQGRTLRVNLFSNPTGAVVNGVNVIEADIPASNGVVHVIDKVLLPPKGTVVDTLVGDDRFTTLVAAVTAAGLADTLASGLLCSEFGTFTDLPHGLQQAHLCLELLQDIVQEVVLHVFALRRLFSALFWDTSREPLSVSQDTSGRVTASTTANTALVTIPNTPVSNGVIHVIDTVI